MPYAVRDGCNCNAGFAVQHAKACTLFVPLFVSTASGVKTKLGKLLLAAVLLTH
jgi:hypothetical protein